MRPVDVIRTVAPQARPDYVTAFAQGDGLFAAANVTTPLRLAHFLAQVLEETGGLTITDESGNYSPARICEVWPTRFRSIAEAGPYARDPEKLFNTVYADRMGNGPPSSGDGFKFRGRGILQTTGRAAYSRYGRRCGADFVGDPDLICSPPYALQPALAEWTDAGCNALADNDDIHAITRRINGGYINFAERVRWLGIVKPVIGGKVELEPLAGPQPKPAPVPPGRVDPVGAGGSLVAALMAAGKALDSQAPWPVVVALVAVGALAATHFIRPTAKA
ncbi:MAG TPA: glycoside hydrolase family 19 protein [Xanthobacteraceae bacterium]|nr:glycoside hydrolase family 19 protein [Xanthobacteraceae bacterium]